MRRASARARAKLRARNAVNTREESVRTRTRAKRPARARPRAKRDRNNTQRPSETKAQTRGRAHLVAQQGIRPRWHHDACLLSRGTPIMRLLEFSRFVLLCMFPPMRDWKERWGRTDGGEKVQKQERESVWGSLGVVYVVGEGTELMYRSGSQGSMDR